MFSNVHICDISENIQLLAAYEALVQPAVEPTPPYGAAVLPPVVVAAPEPLVADVPDVLLPVPTAPMPIGESAASPAPQRRSTPQPPVAAMTTVVTSERPSVDDDSLNGDSLDTPLVVHPPTHLRYVYRPQQPEMAPSYATSLSGSPMHASIHDEAHRRKLSSMAHHSFW